MWSRVMEGTGELMGVDRTDQMVRFHLLFSPYTQIHLLIRLAWLVGSGGRIPQERRPHHERSPWLVSPSSPSSDGPARLW